VATEKERELIAEITSLAMDIGAGEYSAFVDYHGHIHGFDARVSKKDARDYCYYAETVYLSGRTPTWTEKDSIPQLEDILHSIKKYHPAFDADGVKL
jgi:hypothetical protein